MKTTRIRSVIIIILSICVLLLGVAACAQGEPSPAAVKIVGTPRVIIVTASGSVESAPLTEIKTSTPPPPQYVDGIRVITLTDQGGVIQLAPGDRVILSLGEQYDWEIEAGPESVFRPVMGEPPANSQGVFEAVAPGNGTLRANGEPACAKATPACAMPSILFEVAILVK